MNTAPLLTPIAPEKIVPASAPQPYAPDWLNALSEQEREAPELKEFWRQMHISGGEHVSRLFWRYESKTLKTPLLPNQGSLFFLDCGRGPFAVPAAHVFEGFLRDRDTYCVRRC